MTDQCRSTLAWDQARELGYSLRRHYVDQFHLRNVPYLPKSALVLDLGGNRVSKRGLFDVEMHELRVVYANLSAAKQPHVQADASLLPFPAETFDAIICSELLEHVPDPRPVLEEIRRTLRPRGIVLICAPFLNRIHGDPYDFARFTDFFWRETLTNMGFGDVGIEYQGGYWSVLADMVRDLAYHKSVQRDSFFSRHFEALAWIMGHVKQKAVEWDRTSDSLGKGVPRGYATGFGIKATKR
jgi:SAM-dependent methyltransferase